MQELIPININIGDRPFRVKIRPEDEGAVRNTLKIINDKIIEYKTHFAGKDMQDYISMVILWYATQPGLNSDGGFTAEFTDSLSKMEEQLDRILS
ncbi:MAG TPA: cell division protein ZapA [Puia sp.]|nr:cell division protein ZapA [Puia sp.]